MKNENLSAFPLTGEVSYDGIGLSKREYFAAMAMQGILSNPAYSDSLIILHSVKEDYWIIDEGRVSELSLRCADSILLELQKTNL